VTNPCVNSGSSFGDFFWVDSYLVFVDYFKVNRGCVHWRIHASALETVLVMNTESAVTQFSLTISDSTGADCADKSMRHLWKQFRWRFWVDNDSVFFDYFWVNRVVCADESMRQLWKQFQWWFLSQQRLSFPRLFLTQQGLCALTNPCISSRNGFGDDFWVGSYAVFLYCFWVNRGCARWQIHASALQTVFMNISESATT